ncbi:tape measure protein [Ectopseudomonas khazarica]|uniref:tape measure protein n=1 Tax=Ectopseudomonas khazarica TaxID=2502979 RepID=UPI004033D61E
MSQEVQGMLIQIEATTAQLRREMQAADQMVAKTNTSIERSLAGIDQSFDRSAQAAQRAGNLMRGAFAAIAGAGLVGGIIKQVDAVGQMEDRMRAATGSSFEYNKIQQALIATAKQTYRPLAEAQELYLLTADSIKSMGYNTQQTLDITDSFSYLLVTNAASADKGRAALDAYSTALMTNKVGADQWRSILSAMPTVVNALSDATGKSIEEIKRLGIEGKLSIEDLNKGFLLTVEQNQAAAARMRASVTDALVNINTAIGVYLGQMESGTGAVGLLADALGVVAENIDVVAGVMAGAGVAALTLYVARTGLAIKAAYDDRTARIAQAKAVLEAAIADQRKAQTAVFLAQKEAAAAKGTAVQTQMSIQLAQARQREASATVAVSTAQAGLKTASAGLLSVLGGPVGLALMAGTAAASFLMLRDNSAEARIGLEEIKRPVQELREEFQGLARDQREAALLRWKDEQARAAEDVKAAYAEMGAALRAALVDQSAARSPGYVQQLQQYQELINRLNQARAAGEDLAPILRDIAAGSGIPTETLESLIKQAGALSESDDKAARLAEILRVLTADLDVNTAAVAGNAAAHGQLSKSASDYIAAIEKRTAAIEDGNDPIKQANRHIEEHGKYTEAEAKAILRAAEAQKTAQDARAKATEGRKASTKGINDELRAIDALIAKYDPAAKAQKDYAAGVKVADAALAKKSVTATQYQKIIQGLNKDLSSTVWEKHKAAVEEAEQAYKKAADAMQAIDDRLNPAAAAARKYAAEQRVLDEALDEGALTLERHAELMQQLGREYENNQRAADQWAQFTQGAVDRVDEAFADAWRNVFDGSEDLWSGLKKGFQQTLAELAHMAITKPIIVSFANQMLGTNTAGGIGDVWGGLFGGGSAGGGSSGLGGAVQMANQARSLYSMYGTAQSLLPILQGGYASGGIGGALGGVGSYLGGFLGGSSAAASSYAGSVASGYTGSAYASWAAGQGAGAAGGGMFSGLGGMASAWPLAVLAGIWQSGKLYDQGVRPSAGDMWASTQGNALGQIGNVAPTLMSGFYKGLDSVLEPVVGGKLAAMITGSTFHQALWGGINKKLFGGEWKTKDYGIGLGIEDGELDAAQFEYRKKKGGLFSSSKKKTIWRDLDPEVQAALDETYAATADGVFDLFESLSYTIEDSALSGLKLARTQISTQGKTEEEIQAAIAEWFGTAANAMTAELQSVFGTGLDLDFAGMQAFVGNLKGVNEVIRYLNVDMFDMTVAGGKLAEQLAGVAGGLDALAGNASTYYGAFFTEAERMDDTLDAVTRAFEAADVQLAESREAYRAMVEDIDLTTEAGQQMFATLMALSGQAASYYDILESRAAQQRADTLSGLMNGAGSAYSMLQRSVQAERNRLTREFQAQVAQQQAANQQQALNASARANMLQSMADTSQAMVTALEGIDKAFASALERLRDTSAVVVALRREQGLELLRGALVQARAGKSLTGVDGLEGALDVAATLDRGSFESLEALQREQGRTANLIAELQALNGKQLSAEEKLLQQLQGNAAAAQASAGAIAAGVNGVSAQLQAEYDAAMAALDTELENAQLQLDAMNGIDNSILAVGVAIDRMNAAIVAAINGQTGPDVSGTEATIERLYRSILGYSADSEGQKFWQDALASGAYSYGDLIAGLRAQAGADVKAKVPAFATGGLHSGGLRLVGEDGPELEVTGPARIYNASQTAAMLSGGGSESAAELRALRADVSGLMDGLRSIAKHTMQTARRVEFLERWDVDGLPEEREAV